MKKNLKIFLSFTAIIVLIILPFILFDSSIQTETSNQSAESKGSLQLLGNKELDIEQLDENPLIMYQPDTDTGFSYWLKNKIELPQLELPKLEIEELDIPQSFPPALSSLSLNLEEQIRQDWPLPDFDDNFISPELKTFQPKLICINQQGDTIELLNNPDEYMDLLSQIDQELQPTILHYVIKNNNIDIQLLNSSGSQDLDNFICRKITHQFFSSKLKQKILTGQAYQANNKSEYLIIEWRFALLASKKAP